MGKPRNTRKYPTYPEIPEIPGNTQKKKRYPEIPDHIFRHSYPTRTQPATRYFVQYPTRPNQILKNPTRWALPGIFWDRISLNFLSWDFTKKVWDLSGLPYQLINLVNFIHFGGQIIFVCKIHKTDKGLIHSILWQAARASG